MLGVLETAFLSVVAALFVGIAGFNLVTFLVAFGRPPRPRYVLSAFVKEMAAGFALIPWWPLFALLGARYEARIEGVEPARRRTPVILLHGYMMNRTNWLWLGHVLARRGIGPLFGFSYVTLSGVARAARRLGRFVDAVAEREGVERVDLVAHSMGGLVAREFIERMGGGSRVRRLVTIATPHRGTAWSRVAIGGARHDLGAAVREPLDTLPPDGVLYTSIWSRCDNMVIPPESAQLTRPAASAASGEPASDLRDDVTFDDLGHLSLLVSPRVADVVATRLAA